MMDTFLTILFYTITNLQGSQTRFVTFDEAIEFYTITNLQGSQTGLPAPRRAPCFTPLQTYKVLKLCRCFSGRFGGFTPLQTYKVLKPAAGTSRMDSCFTPLQTYKVLKPQMRLSPNQTYWLICVSYLVMYKTHVFIY